MPYFNFEATLPLKPATIALIKNKPLGFPWIYYTALAKPRCSTQAFFAEMIMQPNFIPERRRELRLRAGLRDHDRKAGALSNFVRSNKFHNIVRTKIYMNYILKRIPILHAGAEVSFRPGGWIVHR